MFLPDAIRLKNNAFHPNQSFLTESISPCTNHWHRRFSTDNNLSQTKTFDFSRFSVTHTAA